jgi:hypothetical protein
MNLLAIAAEDAAPVEIGAPPGFTTTGPPSGVFMGAIMGLVVTGLLSSDIAIFSSAAAPKLPPELPPDQMKWDNIR